MYTSSFRRDCPFRAVPRILLMAPVSRECFLSVCYDGIHMKTHLQESLYGDEHQVPEDGLKSATLRK